MRIGFFDVTIADAKIKEKEMVLYLAYDKYFKRYKVGITSKPINQRIKQISDASGTELMIIETFPGSRINEKKLHKYLKEYKLKGEWYRYDKTVEDLFHRFMIGVITGF